MLLIRSKFSSVASAPSSTQTTGQIVFGNWNTDLDPLVRLEGHASVGLDVEEGDVLRRVGIHAIDGFRKLRICVKEMWSRHNDWNPIGALQVQQPVNARLEFESL